MPELALLFGRTPASILAKMANLDGSRPNGAKHEVETAERMLSDPHRLLVTYELIVADGRDLGISPPTGCLRSRRLA